MRLEGLKEERSPVKDNKKLNGPLVEFLADQWICKCILCEKSGILHLVELALTGSRRQASR